MTEQEIFQLCDRVRETSFALHCFLKHGLKEKIYENGLAHRLTKQGYAVTQQGQLQVFDEDDFLLGNLEMDLVVENELIIELKAVKNLTNEHVAQLLGYLRATRKEHGLLINFGNPKLQIKKYVLSKDL
ncbi:GxxExxY protein [Roseibacillus persicicus]|uniref:GxxExxY protein n=1 Tax=Roseibacillus persicicus TaxID=454148 RepID=UPI00280C85D3|nr:GxxExxY protein [Roseibacillus persicicus]MDQ8189703.1 GxxExxY protein [Roseibacillus persicicus]